MRAIVEKDLAGEGLAPAEQRSDHIRDTEPDPQQILTAWGTFSTEIGPRVAPILTLARDAAISDPEIAAMLDEISAARLERMTLNARGLSDAGHLRPGITVEQAADILWTYSSPELYDLLVTRRGWPAERFGSFVGQALIAALLPLRAPEIDLPAPSNRHPYWRSRPDQPDLAHQSPDRHRSNVRADRRVYAHVVTPSSATLCDHRRPAPRPGLIVASLASRPPITVYWDGMPT